MLPSMAKGFNFYRDVKWQGRLQPPKKNEPVVKVQPLEVNLACANRKFHPQCSLPGSS